MASEAPSWADQWGAGGFGALPAEDENTNTNRDTKKKDSKVPTGGFGKAKAAAITGAQKIMMGTSTGFKWVKNQCHKKTPSK